MAKKKKKTLKQRLDKGRKSRLRDDMLKDNYYQRTTQKTQQSEKIYNRKNQKPPETEE